MFIKLGDINFRILILLIYPAGIIPARITSYYFHSNPYFYLFLFFISHFLIVFFKLFYIIKDKCNNKIRNDSTDGKIEKQINNPSSLQAIATNIQSLARKIKKKNY